MSTTPLKDIEKLRELAEWHRARQADATTGEAATFHKEQAELLDRCAQAAFTGGGWEWAR